MSTRWGWGQVVAVCFVTLTLAGCQRGTDNRAAERAEQAAAQAQGAARDAEQFAGASNISAKASENNAKAAEEYAKIAEQQAAHPTPPPPTRTAVVNFKTEDYRNANLRSGPGKSTAFVASVPRYSTVTLLGSSAPDPDNQRWRWYQVSYQGNVGWLHENSLEGE
ncbi:MAG: SH3 domain-containing protein [Byssovorax sp.]